jgi:uncharacterized membrane protein YgaE (UPF0421/DUF939 family)
VDDQRTRRRRWWLGRRGRQRLRDATERGRDNLRAGFARLRIDRWLIAQTAAAAALAWLLAVDVFRGRHAPGFAPVAAALAVGVTRGQQIKRAIELLVGVALGAGAATLVGFWIGSPALRIAVMVAVAMTLAVLLGGSTLFVLQANMAAIFLATAPSPTVGLAGQRLVEALIGGGVALTMTQLLFPLHPMRELTHATQVVFNRLAGVLEETAYALASGDLRRAQEALAHARAIDPLVRRLEGAVSAGHELARAAPVRRRTLGQIEPYVEAARQVDYAVRNARVLARSAVTLVRDRQAAPEVLVRSIRELAEAVRTLGGEVVTRDQRRAAQRIALRAAALALAAVPRREDVPLAMIAGTVRSTVIDLLRGSGMDLAAALEALDEATGSTVD